MKEHCGCNNNQHTSSGENPIARGIFTGGMVGLLCSILFSALFALVLLKYDASPAMVTGFSVIVSALSSAAAGFTAAKIIRKNGFFMGLACAAALLLLLTAVGICTCGVQFNTGFAVKSAVMCIAGIFGGIIGVNVRKPLK